MASNFEKLRTFYASHHEGAQLSEKALTSMGFFDREGHLANGACLFTDDYDGNKTKVQCAVFSGFHKGSERIVTINRFGGNLTDSIQYMMDFVLQRMNHAIVKQEDGRINVDAFPQRALFEGIVNAVAHRDYFLDGTQIQLDLFRDRLEISSPGGFYGGEKLGITYDLSGVISKRRNELISAVLVACNVMEAAGTGFDKIMEEYADADESHRPYIHTSSDHFTLVLPDLTYEAGLSGVDAVELIYVPVANGTTHDEKVLSFCYYQARKVPEIATYLGIADSSYLRQKVLKNLADQEYLIPGKVSRATYYKTNREMVQKK